jgi:hypothetical protein
MMLAERQRCVDGKGGSSKFEPHRPPRARNFCFGCGFGALSPQPRRRGWRPGGLSLCGDGPAPPVAGFGRESAAVFRSVTLVMNSTSGLLGLGLSSALAS